MTPSMTWANDDPDPWGKAHELRLGALAASDGDTTAAFILLSYRTRDVTDGANVLQGDLKVCEGLNARYEKYYGLEDRSWLRKSWDSDVVKVGIFIGGIWLGTRIVKNVN
jgi:hypothetical protein